MKGNIMKSITALLLMLAASLPASADTAADVDALIAILEGEYSNLPIVAAARDSAADSTNLPVEHRDVHHMYATPIDTPGIPGKTVYIEWRHDGPEGDISGQRVWSYTQSADGVVMRFFTLYDSARAILDGVTKPDPRTQALSLDMLHGYPDGCAIVFQRSEAGFIGENAPGACFFPTRDDESRIMTVDATLRMEHGLHGERTVMWFGPPGAPPAGEGEIEDWVYARIR